MILYFADRHMNILGQASTELPKGLHVSDDLKTEEVEAGVATLEFTLNYTDDTRKDAKQYSSVGNYILRKNGDEQEFYTIITSEEDIFKQEVEIYAEDAGMDLLNETVGEYKADKAYPASYYVEKFSDDSGFEVGINEVSNYNRKLSWDGETTASERILSVATQFDAEVSYTFEIDRLKIKHKYINLHKKRGVDQGRELRINREVKNIIVKSSVEDLATALSVTGGYPEDSETPINLKGYKYDDGDIYLSGSTIYSRSAVAKWSRYLSEKGNGTGHIVQTYTYDTLSQSELCNRAVSKLKKIYDAAVSYEVEMAYLPDGIKIGDTVNIVDDAGELYLSARIMKLESSICNDEYTATLGEYQLKSSGISEKMENLAAQFEKLAKNRTFYTWVVFADTETGDGISLKSAGKTYMGIAYNQTTKQPVLTDPSIYAWVKAVGDQGIAGEPGKDGLTSFFHVRYADVPNPTANQMRKDTGKYIGTYVDYILEDSTDPTKYTWRKFQGDDGEDGADGTPGENGANGETSYLHIAYATSADGKTGFSTTNAVDKTYIGQYVDFTKADSTNPAKYRWSKFQGPKGDKGDTGKGVKSTAVTYQTASSGTTVPTGTWSSSVPSASAGQYLWTRTVITYTDNTSSTLYSVGRMGTNGTNGSNGANGKSIGSITNYYLATPSASGVTASTSGWTTSVQSVSASKKYLWNYEVVKYTDGTVASTTAPCIIGSYGDTGSKGDKGDTGSTGNGIKSIAEHYSVSASNSSAPTSWSSTVPTMTESNKYLWNYETITYTNGTMVDTTKRVIGVYGNKGTTGATGNAALQVKRNWSGTYVTVGQTTTVATGDFNRTPVAGDVFIALDGSSNTGTWLVTNVSGTTVSIKLLAYVNSKGDAGADGNSVCTLTTNYSYTQAEIDKYSADNYSGIWAVTSTNGARVGDLVLLRVTNKTKNGYSYILAKITSIVSSTSVKCTSTGSIDKGATGATGPQGPQGAAGKDANQVVHTVDGNGESNLYVEFATIKITGSYANQPTTFKLGGRGFETTDVQFSFISANNSDPGLDFLRSSGGWSLWIYKKTTSTWGLITRLNESYGHLRVFNYTQGSGPYTVTWTSTKLASLPSGSINANPLQAARTATNFMEFTSGNGLQIGNKTDGSWSGYRTKISASAFEILNQTGTTLAYYGDKLIQLGKNAKDSVIELCGGLGKIQSKQYSGYQACEMSSDFVALRSTHQAVLSSSTSTGNCMVAAAENTFGATATTTDSTGKTTKQGDIDISDGVVEFSSIRNGYDCTVGVYAGGWSGGTYRGSFSPSKGYTEKVLLGDNGAGQLWDRLMAKNATQIMSDRREKFDIKPLGPDVESQIATMSLDSEHSNANPVDIHSELFDRLQPVQYKMVNDDQRIRFGFVAQDVVDAMKELGIREDELDLVHHDQRVTENGYNDTYGMVYTNLIALVTHELQLEKQRRSNLEIEVADLRSELESMRDNISGDTN